jgi:hypothetical protein
MNTGIITYTTENYYDLCLELVNSVLEFSSLPVTVYTVGFKKQHSNQRVTTVYIDEEKDFTIWQTKCFYKHLICSLTPYDVTIYLDTDIIVTPDFESFFKTRQQQILDSNTLLGVVHPHSPSTNIDFPVRPYINQFFNKFGVNEIPGYLLTSLFAYNRNLIPFFKQLYLKDVVLAQQNIIPVAGEEMVLNLYLYKKNLLEGTDCGYDISPNYSEGFFESFIQGNWETCEKYLKDYKKYNRQVLPILFHGNKDPDYAKNMIIQIKKKYGI